MLWERTTEPLQELVERSPQAAQYDTDDFVPYHALLYYPGRHAVDGGRLVVTAEMGRPG